MLFRSDRFTVNSEIGNGALNYPVGLITMQEQKLAYVSSKSPLATENWYWSLAPRDYKGSPNVYIVDSDGDINNRSVGIEYGARPAVSLRAGTLYKAGDGSVDSPYVILTD